MAPLNDSTPPIPPTRHRTGSVACRQCGARITRPAYHSGGRLHRRIFCGKPCFDAHLRTRRIAVAGKPPMTPTPSLHRVASVAYLPDRCPKCETGLMKPIALGGRSCLTCGFDVYAVSELHHA